MLSVFLFESIAQARRNFTNLIDSLSVEQLNEIPKGFNNNVIWNYGHIISATESLCYALSGNTPNLDESLRKGFAKGTKPEKYYSSTEISELKKLSVDLLKKLEMDYNSGLFKTFSPYPTSFGLELKSIEEALQFLPVHEGLHYGYAMAQRKVLLNK